MSEELKPCPFCGRPANIHSWYSDKDECGVAWVGCTKESYANGYECARISIMRIDEKTAHEDAIAAWNRRADLRAATVGRGTCHMETADGCQNWNSCSECGADYYTDQPINYCPNCGRRCVG